MTRDVLFLAISGQRFTRRTDLYKKLELVAGTEFPDQTFAFLGNPLKKLPFPLKWRDSERLLDPTTKLLECWATLHQFCVDSLLPALQDPSTDVVITDGFGLDGLLYATACIDCADSNEKAWKQHSGLVSLRLNEQGVSAPRYIITHGDVDTIDRIYKRHADLHVLPRELRHRFIRHEAESIKRYFGGHVAHQHAPCHIPASLSPEQMLEQALNFIRLQLAERKAQKAA